MSIEPTPPPISFDLLSVEELDAMIDRAWREAARCWSEYRAAVAARVSVWGEDRIVLRDAARSAEDFWKILVAERKNRS